MSKFLLTNSHVHTLLFFSHSVDKNRAKLSISKPRHSSFYKFVQRDITGDLCSRFATRCTRHTEAGRITGMWDKKSGWLRSEPRKACPIFVDNRSICRRNKGIPKWQSSRNGRSCLVPQDYSLHHKVEVGIFYIFIQMFSTNSDCLLTIIEDRTLLYRWPKTNLSTKPLFMS